MIAVFSLSLVLLLDTAAYFWLAEYFSLDLLAILSSDFKCFCLLFHLCEAALTVLAILFLLPEYSH